MRKVAMSLGVLASLFVSTTYSQEGMTLFLDFEPASMQSLAQVSSTTVQTPIKEAPVQEPEHFDHVPGCPYAAAAASKMNLQQNLTTSAFGQTQYQYQSLPPLNPTCPFASLIEDYARHDPTCPFAQQVREYMYSTYCPVQVAVGNPQSVHPTGAKPYHSYDDDDFYDDDLYDDDDEDDDDDDLFDDDIYDDDYLEYDDDDYFEKTAFNVHNASPSCKQEVAMSKKQYHSFTIEQREQNRLSASAVVQCQYQKNKDQYIYGNWEGSTVKIVKELNSTEGASEYEVQFDKVYEKVKPAATMTNVSADFSQKVGTCLSVGETAITYTPPPNVADFVAASLQARNSKDGQPITEYPRANALGVCIPQGAVLRTMANSDGSFERELQSSLIPGLNTNKRIRVSPLPEFSSGQKVEIFFANGALSYYVLVQNRTNNSRHLIVLDSTTYSITQVFEASFKADITSQTGYSTNLILAVADNSTQTFVRQFIDLQTAYLTANRQINAIANAAALYEHHSRGSATSITHWEVSILSQCSISIKVRVTAYAGIVAEPIFYLVEVSSFANLNGAFHVSVISQDGSVSKYDILSNVLTTTSPFTYETVVVHGRSTLAQFVISLELRNLTTTYMSNHYLLANQSSTAQSLVTKYQNLTQAVIISEESAVATQALLRWLFNTDLSKVIIRKVSNATTGSQSIQVVYQKLSRLIDVTQVEFGTYAGMYQITLDNDKGQNATYFIVVTNRGNSQYSAAIMMGQTVLITYRLFLLPVAGQRNAYTAQGVEEVKQAEQLITIMKTYNNTHQGIGYLTTNVIRMVEQTSVIPANNYTKIINPGQVVENKTSIVFGPQYTAVTNVTEVVVTKTVDTVKYVQQLQSPSLVALMSLFANVTAPSTISAGTVNAIVTPNSPTATVIPCTHRTGGMNLVKETISTTTTSKEIDSVKTITSGNTTVIEKNHTIVQGTGPSAGVITRVEIIIEPEIEVIEGSDISLAIDPITRDTYQVTSSGLVLTADGIPVTEGGIPHLKKHLANKTSMLTKTDLKREYRIAVHPISKAEYKIYMNGSVQVHSTGEFLNINDTKHIRKFLERNIVERVAKLANYTVARDPTTGKLFNIYDNGTVTNSFGEVMTKDGMIGLLRVLHSHSTLSGITILPQKPDYQTVTLSDNSQYKLYTNGTTTTWAGIAVSQNGTIGLNAFVTAANKTILSTAAPTYEVVIVKGVEYRIYANQTITNNEGGLITVSGVEQLKTYLGLNFAGDYQWVLASGEWYYLFKNGTVALNEITICHGGIEEFKAYLIQKLSLDPKSTTFTIEMTNTGSEISLYFAEFTKVEHSSWFTPLIWILVLMVFITIIGCLHKSNPDFVQKKWAEANREPVDKHREVLLVS